MRTDWAEYANVDENVNKKINECANGKENESVNAKMDGDDSEGAERCDKKNDEMPMLLLKQR